jgi:predicted small metal-binding protein
MKQMTCSAMGGPATCTAVLSGNTAEEMVADGTKHVTEAHPEMAADIKKMSPEDTAKWFAEFQQKFDALPELPV